MRIRGKTVLSGVIAVVASIAITAFAVLNLMRGELTDQAQAYQDVKLRMLHELLHAKGEPKIVDGKLAFGSYVVNGNYEVVDKLTELAGGTATIFQGDTRVATNVKKDDGTRAVGTQLVGVAKDVTIGRVQPYRGEADILGVPYFTAYDPVTDAGGKTFAVLYVGVKQEEFFRSFKGLIGTAVAIAIALAVVAGISIWYMAGRLLGRVSELAKAADAVSVGEGLDVPLLSESDDEVGELTKAVDRLRESMRAAMKRLDT
jgi:methyl-accepting chemotaxis protein